MTLPVIFWRSGLRRSGASATSASVVRHRLLSGSSSTRMRSTNTGSASRTFALRSPQRTPIARRAQLMMTAGAFRSIPTIRHLQLQITRRWSSHTATAPLCDYRMWRMCKIPSRICATLVGRMDDPLSSSTCSANPGPTLSRSSIMLRPSCRTSMRQCQPILTWPLLLTPARPFARRCMTPN